MTLQNAIDTYKEQVESLQEHEWLEWVKLVNHALITGNESMLIENNSLLDWVPKVYRHLRNEANGISMSDSN